MAVVTATQGVRRSLLVPALDGFLEYRGPQPSNPKPFGSDVFFSPPPYISSVDVSNQTVEIANASALFDAALGGFVIRDSSHSVSVFTFPAGYMLRPGSRVTLYCCPGLLEDAELEALPEPRLFWKTMEGNLRRKTFLASEECVVLCDPRGIEVSSLHFGDSGTEMRTPAARQAQLMGLRKIAVIFCYSRIACIACAASRATRGPFRFVAWSAAAHAADLTSRWLARRQRAPLDTMALCLATLGDRLATLCMLGPLVLAYPRAYSGLFVAMLFVDVSSFWLQLACHALMAGKLRPPTRKEVEAELVGYMCTHYPSVISAITFGNELFLMALYLLSPAIHPLIFGGGGGGRGLFADAEAGDESSFGATLPPPPPAMPWLKPLLAPLMLCCVIRQLANAVQILISLSRLSSGVLLEATRRDVLGTPVPGGGNGHSGSAAAASYRGVSPTRNGTHRRG